MPLSLFHTFDFVVAAHLLIAGLRYKENFSLSFVCVYLHHHLFNSSLWGQSDIIYTTGLLASIYYVL
jgi:Gpi18-like mannosyltransferase